MPIKDQTMPVQMPDADIISFKTRAYDALHNLASGRCSVSDIYHADARYWGSHPINEIAGMDAIADVWTKLRHAMPDLERRDSIFTGGIGKPDSRMPADVAGRQLVASMGVIQGTMTGDLFDIPATNGVVHLRVCEVHHLRDGRIAHSYVLFDFLDLMRQAGVWPMAPSLGAEGMWPAPTTQGVRITENDGKAGQNSMDIVLGMHEALGSFDGKSVHSMKHGDAWTGDFLWYGPAGIGSTRGMAGFQQHHQIPFLVGWPDRQGAGHYVRIADANFVVTGGWPSVRGTHLGEWLGLPPTGRKVDMRVMDFYHLVDGRIHENWVPIDIIHIMLQMGVDVFARLRHLRGAAPTDLPQQ
jgi:predicted ester cyclase